MVKRCCVCDIKDIDSNKSFFKIPEAEELRQEWITNMGIKRSLCANSFFCEDHFRPEDVISGSRETLGRNGQVLIASVPYKSKRLRKGAVPRAVVTDSPLHSNSDVLKQTLRYNSQSAIPSELNGVPDLPLQISTDIDIKPSIPPTKSFFETILISKNEIVLPSSSWNWHYDSDAKILALTSYSFANKLIIRKEVFIDSETVKFQALGKEVDLPSIQSAPTTVNEFASYIAEIDRVNVCQGYPFYTYFANVYFHSASKDQGVMRHKNCPVILERGNICRCCLSLDKTLVHAVQNAKKERLRIPRISYGDTTVAKIVGKRYRTLMQRQTRKEQRIEKLQAKLVESNKAIEKLLSKK